MASPSPERTVDNFAPLQIIDRVDKWPYFQTDPARYRAYMANFYYFMIDTYPIPLSYIHKNFVKDVIWPSAWRIDETAMSVTPTPQSIEERSKAINDTLWTNLNAGRVIRKWFQEQFPLMDRDGNHLLSMDGCGVDIFGVVSYGVHMTGFWTFPGLLDNFVSGNLVDLESPMEGMIREVREETGIAEDYTRQHAVPCGTVTYQMTATNDGREGCQHHCQYVFEMELKDGVVPRRNDGEVDSFTLMTLDEVKDALMNGEFTPNRVMTYFAHFVRHGIINAENERRLAEVTSRLHRKHDLFIV